MAVDLTITLLLTQWKLCCLILFVLENELTQNGTVACHKHCQLETVYGTYCFQVKSSSFYFLYLLEFFSAINLYVLLYSLLLLFSYSYSMTWNTHNAMIESQIFILYTSEPIKRTVANFKVVLFSYKENVSIHENVHVWSLSKTDECLKNSYLHVLSGDNQSVCML